LVKLLTVSLREFVEAAPARIGGGYWILREPLAAGVVVEVLARLARFIENRDFDAVIGGGGELFARGILPGGENLEGGARKKYKNGCNGKAMNARDFRLVYSPLQKTESFEKFQYGLGLGIELNYGVRVCCVRTRNGANSLRV
jgi:hypothetical protein